MWQPAPPPGTSNVVSSWDTPVEPRMDQTAVARPSPGLTVAAASQGIRRIVDATVLPTISIPRPHWVMGDGRECVALATRLPPFIQAPMEERSPGLLETVRTPFCVNTFCVYYFRTCVRVFTASGRSCINSVGDRKVVSLSLSLFRLSLSRETVSRVRKCCTR
jgi:hypothetical protein